MYQIHSKFYRLLFITGVLLNVIVFHSSAQTRVIDSLENVLPNHHGIARFDVLYDLAFEYIGESDFQTALEYLDEASNVSVAFGDSLKVVKSKRVRAQVLRRLSRMDEAIVDLLDALPIAKRNSFTQEVKYILNGLSVSYTLQANYDKALEYQFEALVLKEKDGNNEEIRESLNNIGLVYFKLKNYDKALEYYFRALEHDNTLEKSNFRDQLLINIGLCYNQIKNFEEARKYFKMGIDFCNPNCMDVTLISGEFGLGVSYYGQQKYVDAKQHFQRSLANALKNDKRYTAENLVYLGHIYVFTEQFDSALIVLNASEKIASEFGYNELLISAYKDISNVYSKVKNYEEASAYQAKYITLKDSIYSAQLIDRIAKIQTNYAERENIKTIADKEEIIQRQRSFTILIVIIAVLAALLVFVLYRSNAIKKKVNSALSEAKAIIEDQNRQLLNSNIHLNEELKEKNIDLEKANESLRRVNDELDNFIYKTSHDIRGPLASLKGMCNVALMDVHDPVALSYLRKLDITAEKLNTILTRLLIVNQINNSVLGAERIDFVSIVNDVLLLEKKKGLPPRLAIRKQIEPDIEFYSDREFVRIIFENLIDNAIKFYNDSQRVDPFVDISVRLEKNHIRITVIDNGIGISQVHPDKIFQMFSRASERSETGGIGLYITKTAVQKLGGIINLKTTPEGDTEFYILLPLATSKVLA